MGFPDITAALWTYSQDNSIISNNSKRKLLVRKQVRLFLGFLPLLLQIFFISGDPICPNDFYGVYGFSVLLLPAVCVIFACIVAFNQSWIKKKSKYYVTQFGIYKVFRELSLFMIFTGVTVGSQFLQGKYYACAIVGPKPVDATLIPQWTIDFQNAQSVSVLIGWLFLLSTLIIFTIIAILYNIRTQVKPTQVLLSKFLELRRDAIENLLYGELERLAKELADQRVKKVLGITKNSTKTDFELVNKFLDGAVKLEVREERRGEPETPNVYIQ